MNNRVLISFADETNAALLAALGAQTFRRAFVEHPLMPIDDLEQYIAEAFALEQIAAELRDPNSIFLLASIGTEFAGYAKLMSGSNEANVAATNPVKLKRLYSKPEFVGKGIGAALMDRCLSEAATRGHDAVWLTVWQHNERAQVFYRKWGFEAIGTYPFQLGGSTMNDVLMLRRVPHIESGANENAANENAAK